MRNYRDIIANILEYITAIMFIRGGIVVLFLSDTPPLYLPGVLTYLVGESAVVVYGLAFLTAGLLLLYSKWFKKKRVHEHTLMAMFLTCAYVLALSIALSGLAVGQILTVVVGLVSAWLWLRWRLKTKYIDPEEFKAEINGLRTDLPPTHRKD